MEVIQCEITLQLTRKRRPNTDKNRRQPGARGASKISFSFLSRREHCAQENGGDVRFSSSHQAERGKSPSYMPTYADRQQKNVQKRMLYWCTVVGVIAPRISDTNRQSYTNENGKTRNHQESRNRNIGNPGTRRRFGFVLHWRVVSVSFSIGGDRRPYSTAIRGMMTQS